MNKENLTKVLGSFATIAMIVSYIPQLYLTYSTKNVEGQSFWFWLLLCVSLTIIQVNASRAYRKNKTPENFNIWVFQTLNVLLADLMLFAVIVF